MKIAFSVFRKNFESLPAIGLPYALSTFYIILALLRWLVKQFNTPFIPSFSAENQPKKPKFIPFISHQDTLMSQCFYQSTHPQVYGSEVDQN